MNKLAKLQQKYARAKYEPDANCSKCGGEGEFWRESKSGSIFGSGYQPCICVFVEPGLLPIAEESLQQTIRKIKSEISDRHE